MHGGLVDEGTSWVPKTAEEKEFVLQQLRRLLETSHFRNSRRYPALFRYIVEETLEGRGDSLKERVLGVQVFGRPADYDTATDPIVRVTVAEIRKRIAQYYHEEAHDHEMRIELLPGRYEAEFRRRRDREPQGLPSATLDETNVELLAGVVEPLAPPPSGTHAILDLRESDPGTPRDAARTRKALWIPAFVIGLAALVLCAVWLRSRPTEVEELWAPLLSSPRPALLCIPAQFGSKTRNQQGEPMDQKILSANPSLAPGMSSGPTFLDFESLAQNVVYSDMLAALSISRVFTAEHHDLSSRLDSSTSFEDLRESPAVLIGGMDNQWTMRALKTHRYRFGGSDDEGFWIADRDNPGFKSWGLNIKQQWGAVTRDYAIIARFHDDLTGQPEFIVAGIGMSGTAAAGEFIADPGKVRELKKRVGAGFRTRDFEAVLSTEVVNGIAGSARILAVDVR